jgi:Tol biopolymer transport system component
MDGSGTDVLAAGATDGVYSPDGSRLALLRLGRHRGAGTTDLFVMDADGSHASRLTSTPGRLELWPSWDPSGRRLAYAQLRAGGGERALIGFGDSVSEINADGTCRTPILASPQLAFYGPTWQPGAGREAGPIAC